LIPNTEKCIKEEFQPDTLVKGAAEITPILGDMQVYMRIADVENNPVYENRDLTKATLLSLLKLKQSTLFASKTNTTVPRDPLVLFRSNLT